MPRISGLSAASSRSYGFKSGKSRPLVNIKLWGAAGGCSQDCGGNPTGSGASGGFVSVSSDGGIFFEYGITLYILVGQGGSYNSGSNTYGGGARHGGSGGGSGGGGTYIAFNTSSFNTSSVILAAGGGAGGTTGNGAGSSGSGGGNVGAGGSGGCTGGTQTSGGVQGYGGFGGGGSAGSNGSFMQGGYGMSCKGSGGGGGWYGGGGGNGDCGACASGAAAGGSSYINTSYFPIIYNNDQAYGTSLNPNASADADWANNAGLASGSSGNHGRAVIYVNGIKYTFGYTGGLQTLTI